MEVRSACRICGGACGLKVNVEGNRVTGIKPDREHGLSEGYICSKALRIPDGMYTPERILHPLKRRPDGSFARISLETAIGEIAEQLTTILNEDGSEAVATFNGTAHWNHPLYTQVARDFEIMIGTPNRFTTATIDQSCHQVTMARMGFWAAGKHNIADADVMLLLGSNPLVSLGAYKGVASNPLKRLKAAKARGMKLIVVDPRRSETAAHADCFLQPVPGEDAAILAALIRMILDKGWQDRAFCEEFVNGVEAMREAVDPFTPQIAGARAHLDPAALEAAAAMFARDARRGIAIVGTGGSMGPHSNLVDHLAETLNVLCGRYLRAGERVPSPGVLAPKTEFRAQVIGPNRMWERGPKLPSGHGHLFGEFPATKMADQMLRQGKGRIRALFVNGGNPAAALPDQMKSLAGLRALDLLVAIEPYLGSTAKLAHYIIPPKLQFERDDILRGPVHELYVAEEPFSQYLPAIVAPPEGAEVIDEWYFYWRLASKLGRKFTFNGVALEGEAPPTTWDLLKLLLTGSAVPLEEVARDPAGYWRRDTVHVLPARAGAADRFELAPADVMAELRAVERERMPRHETFRFRLINRRLRAMFNSTEQNAPRSEERLRLLEAFINPDDMKSLALRDGERVEIASKAGRLVACAKADRSLRKGVIAMTHCRGLYPQPGDNSMHPVLLSSGTLVSTDAEDLEDINAMPKMTSIPVSVARVSGDLEYQPAPAEPAQNPIPQRHIA